MTDVDSENYDIPEFVTSSAPQDVSGDLSVPGTTPKVGESTDKYNTLDEPVTVTIMRDLKAVGRKFWYVLYPREKKSVMKEWDLWGPLILCTFLAIVLQGSGATAQTTNDGGPEFAEVFVVVWAGACVVTLNTKLLGGVISFFQSVCVLGYCLLPTCMSLVVCRIILFSVQSNFLFILRLVFTMIGFIWATFAAMMFLGDCHPPKRKALAIYPIFLFYFVISWLIISRSNV